MPGMPKEPKTVWIRYTFTLEDGRRRVFELNLNPQTMQLQRPLDMQIGPSPEWTQLSYSPCDHCALPPGTTHCPIAVNLAPVVDALRDVVAGRTAEVLVETTARRYSKSGPAQELLFPLLSIYMSASGCPSMEKLKPLLYFHLPFTTLDEQIYRVLTMYVMAQYMRMQRGLEPDWELAGMAKMYDHINKVNVRFCQRLTKAFGEDALVNSLVILDMVSSLVKSPSKANVQKIQEMFDSYLDA